MIFVSKGSPGLRFNLRTGFEGVAGKRTGKPRLIETAWLDAATERGLSKFAYIFSGPLVDDFHRYDIDLVDVVFENQDQVDEF